MEACTKGTVISTNRLWWLKINKKPIPDFIFYSLRQEPIVSRIIGRSVF